MSENQSAIPSSHGDSYIRRISVDEAAERARARDGLEPGAIADNAERSYIRLDSEIVNDPDFESWALGDEDDVEHVLSKYYKIDDSVEAIQELESIASVLLEVKMHEGGDQQDDSLQFEVLHDYLSDFLEEFPEATIDPYEPGSIKGINDFLQYYFKRISEDIDHARAVGFLQQGRQDLVKNVQSPSMQQLLGTQTAERVARQFGETPVIVADPLTKLIFATETNTDALGWYIGKEHSCYIDLASTAHCTQGISEDDSKMFEAQLFLILTHELAHSASSFVFRESVNFEDVTVKAKSQWPQFMYEGMVEKFAYTLAVQARPELFSGKSSRYSELDRRRIRYGDPPEVLADLPVKEARENVGSAYFEYRLLIDTLMDKADWQAAGLTPEIAQEMLTRAFFDRADHTTASPQKDRKDFMEAFHVATSPGLMARIDQIIAQYGIGMAIDILESPDFDPHDTQAIPSLASPELRKRLHVAQESYQKSERMLKRLIETGAPEMLVSQRRRFTENFRRDAALSREYSAAQDALKRRLHSHFGKRTRRPLTAKEQLLDILFGDKSARDKQYEKPEQVASDEDDDIITGWQNMKHRK